MNRAHRVSRCRRSVSSASQYGRSRSARLSVCPWAYCDAGHGVALIWPPGVRWSIPSEMLAPDREVVAIVADLNAFDRCGQRRLGRRLGRLRREGRCLGLVAGLATMGKRPQPAMRVPRSFHCESHPRVKSPARRLLLAVDAAAGRRVVRAVECRPTRLRRECRRRRLLAWASDSQGVCWRLALRAGEQAGRVVLACADSGGGAVAAAVGALRSRAAPMAAAADQDGHVPCGRGSAGPGVSGSALRRG